MLQDYKCAVNAQVSSEAAYRKVAQVSDWWNQRATGETQEVGETFRVNFGETWVDFEVVEAVPNKRLVWYVTDCNLHSFKNRTEWKGTRVAWDLETTNGTTTVNMTHVGLTPEVDCFKACEAGWNFHVGESLLKLLTEDLGLPDHARKANA